MTFFKKLLLWLLALSAASSVGALTMSDVDLDGQNGEPDWFLMKSWKHYADDWNSTFDLLADGFDPLTMRIVGATVSFAFADDYDGQGDYARISVGGLTLWDWQEVDGDHYDAPTSYDWYSTSLNASLLQDLQDGALSYEVEALSGDFYLKEANIVAEVERLRVPDSGMTFAMLGLGLASLFVLRKQMRSGKDA